ncbi:MAG: acyl carrier protein [Burkholderiaceae bacterium]|nr:acyl carrier protein [Burkholderiaceae bacterium]
MTEQEIFELLQTIFEEMFEIEPKDFTLESKLYQDLDIDSVDIVDLLAHLRKTLGNSDIEPSRFESLVTVDDMVKNLHRILA